jgi:hypothetical protein
LDGIVEELDRLFNIFSSFKGDEGYMFGDKMAIKIPFGASIA